MTDQKPLSFKFCQSGRGKIKNTNFRCGVSNWAILSTISFIVLVVVTLCPMHCLAPLRLHQLLSIRLKAHCPILLACTNNLAIPVSLDCTISCAQEISHFQLQMSAKQRCQCGFFEVKFAIFGLFSTSWVFIFDKRPNEIWLFWPFLGNYIFYVDLADLKMILAEF